MLKEGARTRGQGPALQQTEILARGAMVSAFAAIPFAVRRTASLGTFEQVVAGQLEQVAVVDADGAPLYLVGAPPLGVVHQRVGAVNQFRGELARDSAPLANAAQAQAHDPDIDAHRADDEPAIVACPVVLTDGGFEAVRNLNRFSTSGKIGNEEAELVAAEPCVKVA